MNYCHLRFWDHTHKRAHFSSVINQLLTANFLDFWQKYCSCIYLFLTWSFRLLTLANLSSSLFVPLAIILLGLSNQINFDVLGWQLIRAIAVSVIGRWGIVFIYLSLLFWDSSINWRSFWNNFCFVIFVYIITHSAEDSSICSLCCYDVRCIVCVNVCVCMSANFKEMYTVIKIVILVYYI